MIDIVPGSPEPIDRPDQPDTAARRFLPEPGLIPPCPRCGDRDRVELLLPAMPGSLPFSPEAERVQFTVCGRNRARQSDPWWCPACWQPFPWTYPFAHALVVEAPVAAVLVSGEATWLVRRDYTTRRGVVGLSPQYSGTMIGCAELIHVRGPFTTDELRSAHDAHRMDRQALETLASGASLYAWEFKASRRFEAPVPLADLDGGLGWVPLPESRSVVCGTCGRTYEPDRAAHPLCPGSAAA